MHSEMECYYDYGNNTRLRISYTIHFCLNVCSVWSWSRMEVY